MLGAEEGQVNESSGYYALRGKCYTPPTWALGNDGDCALHGGTPDRKPKSAKQVSADRGG